MVVVIICISLPSPPVNYMSECSKMISMCIIMSINREVMKSCRSESCSNVEVNGDCAANGENWIWNLLPLHVTIKLLSFGSTSPMLFILH